jgi:hypothetical protein
MIRKYLVVPLFLSLIFSSSGVKAQEMDCASTVKFRYASTPYQYNEQSKSAICYTGQLYEYQVQLLENVEYRFSFFASSIFNNNIRFKMINLTTGELVLDLPGEAAGNNTSAILEDYFDPNQKKFIHPYYDILPEENCSYKVMVEVGEQTKNSALNNSSILIDANQKKGCVTIFIQSKKSETFGF